MDPLLNALKARSSRQVVRALRGRSEDERRLALEARLRRAERWARA